MSASVNISAPYFEDLRCGLECGSPGVTLTTGHAAIYQAIFGDRLMLPLDHAAAASVTGSDLPLAHPLLAINMTIGQSTWISQRVKANLFYRGLSLLRPVFIGDTLRTLTRVVAMRRNQPKAGRTPTGMVGLEIITSNQHQEDVLHFWRCPMIPCRDQLVAADPGDDLEMLGRTPSKPLVPAWRFDQVPALMLGDRCNIAYEVGTVLSVEARDTVTCAPEFVRLTLNMAMAHTDLRHSHLGARLVYGGHTISMCFAQLSRVLPRLVTLLSWERCDHVAPVVEGDRLRSEFTILSAIRHETVDILSVQARCFAAGEATESETLVLEWVFSALNAVA